MAPKVVFEDEELLVLEKPAERVVNKKQLYSSLIDLIVSANVVKQDGLVELPVDHSDITSN